MGRPSLLTVDIGTEPEIRVTGRAVASLRPEPVGAHQRATAAAGSAPVTARTTAAPTPDERGHGGPVDRGRRVHRRRAAARRARRPRRPRGRARARAGRRSGTAPTSRASPAACRTRRARRADAAGRAPARAARRAGCAPTSSERERRRRASTARRSVAKLAAALRGRPPSWNTLSGRCRGATAVRTRSIASDRGDRASGTRRRAAVPSAGVAAAAAGVATAGR